MTLIPRHIDVENVLNKHDESSGTAEAGAIVYLSDDKKVAKVSSSSHVPFGMLGMKVKSPAAGLPQNFQFPGELGTTESLLGDPVLVYHGGIFESTHLSISGSCSAGDALYASTDAGKLTNVSASGALEGGSPKICAYAQSDLSATDFAAGKALVIKLVL